RRASKRDQISATRARVSPSARTACRLGSAVDSSAQPPMTTRTRSRRGVALFAALALLGLLALLVGGSLAAFRLRGRSSEFSTTDAMLTAAADYALDSVAASARTLGIDTLPLGVSKTFSLRVPGRDGLAPVVVATRLVNNVAWLVADITTI